MIYTIVEIMATILDVVFLIWYIPSFLHTKFYYRENRWALILPVLELLLIFSSDYLFPGFVLLPILGALVIAMVYAILICQKRWFLAILSASSYILVTMFGSSVIFTAFSFIPSFGEALNEVMQGAEANARIIYLVLAKVSQFALFLLLLVLFRKNNNLNRKNSIFVLLYSFLVIFGLAALMTISVSDLSAALNIPIITLLIILVLSILAVYLMIRQVMKMQQKEYEYKLIQEKMNAEKMRAEDAEVIWNNIRKLRHDLKNHFTVIRAKLDQGDTASCSEYIDKINPMIDSMDDMVHTGNAMIDYLINTKFPKEKKIKIIASGSVDNLSDIEDADMVSLLGNILDNAVEAVEQVSDLLQRRVELHFLQQNQNRIIICKNGINKSVLESNKELRSTKKHGDHGLGHKIIESVANKYDGFAEFFESDGMFCVQVVLPKKI